MQELASGHHVKGAARSRTQAYSGARSPAFIAAQEQNGWEQAHAIRRGPGYVGMMDCCIAVTVETVFSAQ